MSRAGEHIHRSGLVNPNWPLCVEVDAMSRIRSKEEDPMPEPYVGPRCYSHDVPAFHGMTPGGPGLPAHVLDLNSATCQRCPSPIVPGAPDVSCPRCTTSHHPRNDETTESEGNR